MFLNFLYYCILDNFFFIALECGAKTAARLLKGFTRGRKITAAAKGLAEWKKESRQCISPGPGSWGYRACQKLWSLITEDMLSYFFFSHLIAYPQIIQPICQLPVQLAAESANKWVSEDLPAGPSVITQVSLPDLQPPHSWGISTNLQYRWLKRAVCGDHVLN